MHNPWNSRWPPPPTWISKIGCHFFTIGQILTKSDGNNENLTKNATVRIEMHTYLHSRWRPPQSWISKMCCHFFAIEPILTNFDGNFENLAKNATVMSTCISIQIQDGVRRHLEFRKLVSISSLLGQSKPKLVRLLKIWQSTLLSVQKCLFTKI